MKTKIQERYGLHLCCLSLKMTLTSRRSFSDFDNEKLGVVKRIRLKHGCKPADNPFTLSASMCYLWHLMWKKHLWLQDAVVQKINYIRIFIKYNN